MAGNGSTFAVATATTESKSRQAVGRRLCRRDHSGQALAYVYFEDEAGRSSAAKLLTRDEARRIAANIAKLPEPASLDARLPRGHKMALVPLKVSEGCHASYS